VTRLRVLNYSVSADGFGAGPNQNLENPLGVHGERLHDWVFATRVGRAMIGESGGSEDIDNDFLAAGTEGFGATIMGRYMFGPQRGAWPDDNWRGWWGDTPPYHHPVFVLTHHGRESIEMAGGTTFHFVTGGIDEALHRARDAAGSQDVRLGGGAATIRQYLQARLIDEMHVAIVPVLLGSGEPLFEGVDSRALGYEVVEHTTSSAVLHVRLQLRSTGTGR
jgi:dihydrofolate reductase